MKGNERSEEIGRNMLRFTLEFSHSNIACEILFVDTFERTQEAPYIGPYAFNGVAMYLADAVTIIIMSMFVISVSDGRMVANDVVIV